MSTSTTTTNNIRSVPLRVTIVLVAIVVLFGLLATQWQRTSAVTVGVEGQRTIEIAGPKLIAAPFTPGDALSVRIASVEPTPDGFRYDLRYMAFGQGEHDICK